VLKKLLKVYKIESRRITEMEDFRSIYVTQTPTKELKIHNPTNYSLIGKGKQGAVFKISPEQCVKIYACKQHAEIEGRVYKNLQGSRIIPKLYEIGHKYIIIEYVPGPTLKKYLRIKSRIPKSLACEILFTFKEMKRLGISRLNVNLRHIIVAKKGSFKVIDHVNSLKHHEPYPFKLFDYLDELGLLRSFLKYAKEIDRVMYDEWKVTMSKYFK
jgi:predicted Ser/Thr protein kinase